jgi:DNA transformation protein and related proteins
MDDVETIRAVLRDLGDISSRPRFGGHGIYCNDVVFGILFGGRLYFNERQTLKSYHEVPPDGRSDPEALLSWAGEAIRAGRDSLTPL